MHHSSNSMLLCMYVDIEINSIRANHHMVQPVHYPTRLICVQIPEHV